MSSINDTSRFLQVIFPDHAQHAIFASGHAPTDSWSHVRGLRNLRADRDCYLSPAAFPDDGSTTRTLIRATEVRCLVIDDVGTEVSALVLEKALGKPTAEVLTSEGSAHWWYVLKEPMPVAEWGAFFTEVARLIGKRTHGPEAHHVFRIPMGVNTKPERNGFKPRLGQFNPEVRLDARAIMLFAEPVPKSERGEATGNLGIEALRELMACIPNDERITREVWVNIVGHGLKALCADDDEGFEVFDAWTETWTGGTSKGSGYNRRTWDSLGASGGLTSRGGKLKGMARVATPEKFTLWEAKVVFDDGVELPPELPKAKGIRATPFKWKDPASLKLRDWLYGNILIRKFITMTVAPGGLGKSSLIASETLAQVTGCALLWEKAARPLRVWLWNLEDPYEETERRILAAALHHKVKEADIGDRLFIDSGRDQKLVIATTDHNKTIIVRPVVKDLISEVKRLGIDVLVIDPFVSCHEVPENDNTAQDTVVKEWGQVAEEGNCAVHLIDHTRKAPNGTEVWTESARGAKAKTDAARVVRVLNRMSDDEGVRHGVGNPRQHFYALLDKANMSLPPPIDHRDWFHMESVNLGNGKVADGVGAAQLAGDSIGVTERWLPPSAETLRTTASFEKVAEAMGTKLWRTDSRAAEWVGKAIGPALEYNEKSKAGRDKTAALLKGWLKDGLLQIVVALDNHRMEKEFIQIKEKHEVF